MPKRISNRPKDVNQAAFQMVQRSTEEQPTKPKYEMRIQWTNPQPSKSEISRIMSAMGKKGGKIGGKRSLETLTPDERKERALKAARARWAKRKK
jgi:hypothetical protein